MSSNPPVVWKKGAGGVRSWLVLDTTGQTQVLEAGKNSIKKRTGLQGRDLRVLDPFLSYPSKVMCRERAIVVNLEHVKAIVMAKEVLLLNSLDPFVSPFYEELRRRIIRHYRDSKIQGDDANDSICQDLLETKDKKSTEPKTSQEPKEVSFQNKDVGDEAIIKAEAKQPQVLPFEFVALEACFEAACSTLENEAKRLELEAYPALDKLSSQITTFNLERARQIKSRLVSITGRVQKVRDELEHLLDDDHDMAEMYLTDKLFQENLEDSSSSSSTNDQDDDGDDDDDDADLDERIDPPEITNELDDIGNEEGVLDRVYSARNILSRSSRIGSSRRSSLCKHNVSELEMLLEAYFVQIDGTLNKLSTMKEYVDDTEDYINIKLDEKQNQLLQLGVLLTTATLVSTIYIVATGIFGMNIRIPLYNTDTPTGQRNFVWTSVVGCAGTVILYVMAVAWFKYKRFIH